MVIAGCLQGVFPMADPDSGEVHWYDPDPRAILPLDSFHLPKSLQRVIRSGRFAIEFDVAFEETIRSCAAAHERMVSSNATSNSIANRPERITRCKDLGR